MKQLKRVMAIVMVLAMVAVNLPVGTGNAVTNADGYIEVRTVEDLYFIRNNLSANYILMNDLDLTEATKKGGDWDFVGNGWNPIGSNDVYGGQTFSGIFDGNGHTISGLRIDAKNVPSGAQSNRYIGLFADVSGTVKNLTLDGTIRSDFGGSTCFVGGIAGYSTGNIQNCVNNATVYGTPEDYSTSNKAYVGGIVGHSYSGSIFRCVNNAEISGYAYASTVNIGGIVGSGGARIVQCYNTGKISASVYGYYSSSSHSAYGTAAGIGCGGTVDNCYNTGKISASYATGSSFSYTYAYAYGIGTGKISDSYNVGDISGADHSYAINVNGSNTPCYYLAGTGAQSTGCTPLTASQMTIQNMYSGFDFEKTWVMDPNAQYPYPQLRNNVQNLEEGASLVSVISWPLQTEYMQGDELVLDGAMISVTYTSGKNELMNVTADMISGYNSSKLGEQTVTVTYRGQSDSFPVTVVERPSVTDISLITLPYQTEFRVGSAFDFTGAQLKVTFSNGTLKMIPVTNDMTSGGNINRIGTHTITVTYYGKTTTFEVKVVPVSISGLRLGSAPTKLTYLEGEELDLTGMTLYTVMNNNTETPVASGYSVSGYDANTPGTQTITIQYAGMTTTFEVTVQAKSLVSLVLEQAPTRKEYIAGEAFSDAGMKLVATYDNGKTEIVTDYEITGFDATPGQKTVVLLFGGKYVTFNVTILPREITDFRIITFPAKLAYLEYEDLDLTGMEVQVTYNDGTTEPVTDYQVAGFSSEVGTHTISVAYGGWVRTFDIIVTPRTQIDLTVTVPNRLTYYVGEQFDAAGMVVTAYYNNGQQIQVLDYQISGFDSATPGTKTITVTYGGMSRSFSVSVSKRSEISTGGSFTVGTAIGRPGQEVRIPVTVSGNIGLAGLRHTISFDAGTVAFVGAEAQGAFASGTMIVNTQTASQGSITIVWFNGSDVEANGTVYELVFRIQDTASEGLTEVQLDFAANDNGNISGENLLFGKNNGNVSILNYWLGDLSGDGKYAMVDLVMLAQYVAGFDLELSEKQLLSADVNEDSTIDIHDVILLNQWLLNEDF